MAKITITKSIIVRRRPADYEALDVMSGFTTEFEYKDEKDLQEQVEIVSQQMRREAMRELKFCMEKFWKKKEVVNND
jgi:hypothetical protein